MDIVTVVPLCWCVLVNSVGLQLLQQDKGYCNGCSVGDVSCCAVLVYSCCSRIMEIL